MSWHRKWTVWALALALCALIPLSAGVAQAAGLKPGRIAISYDPPQDPKHETILEALRQRRLLETFQRALSPIRLPAVLRLKTAGCDGDVNAWYEESNHTVTVCYEYIDYLVRQAPEKESPAGVTRHDAILGPAIEVFLHETSHALFNMLKIPILGREEDAADRVAAYLLLQLDADVARQAVLGLAFFYHKRAERQRTDDRVMADSHGLSAQRFYDLMCLAYGANKEVFGDFVEKGYLPESRADECDGEYAQVRTAYRQLIGPYVDRSLQKKVKAKALVRALSD